MRVLVLGAGGLLGGNVVAAARRRGHDVVGSYHRTEPAFGVPLEHVDVREPDHLRRVVDEYSPAAVVNCAAMTDVDGCESNPEEAFAVNGAAPGTIASICGEVGARFVHVSTDYVFDGTAERPYRETDEPNPRQVYGESNLEGERAVREVAPDALVTRLSFVYGIDRASGELSGFPAWVLARLMDSEPTPLFTDQQVTPTRAGQAAATLLDLTEEGTSGVIHVACRSCVTPYEFGDVLRRLVDAPAGLLVERSMDDVDRAAARPPYSCLDVGRVERELGLQQPDLEEDLSAIADAFHRG